MNHPVEGSNEIVGAAENGPKLIRRMLVTSYVIPDGQIWRFKHQDGCTNEGKDEMWNRAIQEGAAKTISELNTILRLLFGMSGCEGCSVDKELTVGILFDHSQDTSYKPSLNRSTGDSYTSMETPRESAPSWPESDFMGTLNESERKLYKNFKMDNTSDESYKPTPRHSTRKTKDYGEIDVPMTMDDNKNTEATGFGDSKWAVTTVAETRSDKSDGLQNIPETTGTTNESNNGGEDCLPPTIPYDEPEKRELSLWERMDRTEELIVSMRDELEELRDFKKDIKAYGCRKCRGDVKGKGKMSDMRNVDLEETDILEKKPISDRKPVTKTTKATVKQVPYIPAACIPIIPQEKPSYERGIEINKMTFATVAGTESNKNGYQMVEGRKRFMKPKGKTPEPISRISLRERHLKIRFVTDKKVITELDDGITPETIRIALNDTLRDLNERKSYFSVCGKNRFGDILLTLADTKIDDIMVYLEAMKEKLYEMGLPELRFERDAEKVKIYVGMVPLTRAGRINWSPEDWVDDTGYRSISNDVEKSNPGIVVTARPSWVGGLRKMHNRKQSTAGMILVVEKTKEVASMMSMTNPKITLGGKPRYCRAWREENASIMCARCLKIGHVGAGCDAPPACKFCRQSHMSINHECKVSGCGARGVECQHCRKWCLSCNTDMHFTGSTDCVAVRKQSESPSALGPSTAIVSDPTSTTGVSDRSRNRERRKFDRLEKTPLYEKAGDEGAGPSNTNAAITRSSEATLKKNHRDVVLKGDKVTAYEQISVDKGKPVLRKTKKTIRRSSSVPTKGKKTIVSKKDEEESENLEQIFDLFQNDKMIQ